MKICFTYETIATYLWYEKSNLQYAFQAQSCNKRIEEKRFGTIVLYDKKRLDFLIELEAIYRIQQIIDQLIACSREQLHFSDKFIGTFITQRYNKKKKRYRNINKRINEINEINPSTTKPRSTQTYN